MKLREAQLTLQAGGLLSAVIAPSAMREGWMVVLKTRNGEDVAFSSDLDVVRWFKGLDAAFQAVRRIGFNTATIVG